MNNKKQQLDNIVANLYVYQTKWEGEEILKIFPIIKKKKNGKIWVSRELNTLSFAIPLDKNKPIKVFSDFWTETKGMKRLFTEEIPRKKSF